MSRSVIERVNDVVYAVERAVVTGSLLIMAIVVFLDVVHSQYTEPDSKIVGVLARLLWLPDSSPLRDRLVANSTAIALLVAYLIVLAGVRTASRRPLLDPSASPGRPFGWPQAAGLAFGITGASYALLWVLFGDGQLHGDECLTGGFQLRCGVYPNGLYWSRKVALMFTIWAGFLGASMATRDNRHLKVEALQKALPPPLRRWVQLFSGLAAAGFCALLMVLSWRFASDTLNVWIETDHRGGNFEGTDVPLWLGMGVVPLTCALMGLRFVFNGILASQGKLADVEAELGGMELEALDQGDEDDDG